MKLYCKKCNYLLTSLKLEKSELKQICLIDEKELLQDRKYIEANRIDYSFEIPIDYLINSKSISLKDHKDSIRLQGCCGPGNFGVLNQVCPKCKFEIGVLIADCWTPRFIGIDKSKISEKPLW